MKETANAFSRRFDKGHRVPLLTVAVLSLSETVDRRNTVVHSWAQGNLEGLSGWDSVETRFEERSMPSRVGLTQTSRTQKMTKSCDLGREDRHYGSKRLDVLAMSGDHNCQKKVCQSGNSIENQWIWMSFIQPAWSRKLGWSRSIANQNSLTCVFAHNAQNTRDHSEHHTGWWSCRLNSISFELCRVEGDGGCGGGYHVRLHSVFHKQLDSGTPVIECLWQEATLIFWLNVTCRLSTLCYLPLNVSEPLHERLSCWWNISGKNLNHVAIVAIWLSFWFWGCVVCVNFSFVCLSC